MFKQHKKKFYLACALMVVVVFLLLVKPGVSSKNNHWFQRSDTTIGPVGEQAVNQPEPQVVTATTTIASQEAPVATRPSKVTGQPVLVPILIYHHIDKVPKNPAYSGLYNEPEIFEQQLLALKNNSYQTVLIRDVADALINNKRLAGQSVALTFDDGYEDFYQQVFPLLKKYESKATVFVIVNFLNSPGYLKTEQLKEMSASGLVEIGSHTLDHISLKTASDEQVTEEIKNSKSRLENILGQSVEDLAYPYGFFTEREEKIAAEAGYLSAASTKPGKLQRHGNIFSLWRLRPGNRVAGDLIDYIK